VRHRFVNELFAGAVPDAVMARYLIQDHRFLDSFLTLLGATQDEDWKVTFAYRPVHLNALSNEVQSFPPAERTH
jgi:thiaminase